jgi:16S rRNA (guanine966-N2)-methyltransferase
MKKRDMKTPVVKKEGLARGQIIGGEMRGRALLLPVSPTLRPSKQMVRQAVFNMLESRIDWAGMVVADLCCGTGAMGLEALSRGCARVYMVDTDVRAVEANVKLLGLEADPRVVVVRADVLAWAPPTPVDVVLADPPYDGTLAGTVLERMDALGARMWVMEAPAHVDMGAVEGWDCVRRVYGGSAVTLGTR